MNSNIDQTEVDKFASRSEQWWNETGEFKTLHEINPTRLQYIEQALTLNDKAVLDVGCGGGILTEALAERSTKVTGIDAGEQNIACAKQHASAGDLNIDYVCSTAEHFAETHARQFDLVVCMELLEHVPDPLSLIQACAAMTKTGGHVIFSTLNRNPRSYLLAVLAGEYLLNLLPRGTHDYEKFIRPSELLRWCREAGLKLNDISGLDYNPLLKRCRLTDNPTINYLIDTVAA